MLPYNPHTNPTHQGCFLKSNVLNYHAILDTVLDVAKAMCHLHATNVLHSDLKARNVMLKRTGDSRGFIAKVWTSTIIKRRAERSKYPSFYYLVAHR